MKREKIKGITYVSLCVAVLAVISQISIPVGPVPLTLQMLFVPLFGYFLGIKKGTLSIAVYMLLGAIGVPVFAGFQGGVGVLFGYTGGFIFGYFVLVILCGLGRSMWMQIALGITGLVLCHIMGIIQYMILARLDFVASFFVVSLPYILKDIILVVCALFISIAMKKRIKNAV